MPIVAYPDVMTTKSSQFQGFRKYVYLLRINPLATALIIISAVYIARNANLKEKEKYLNAFLLWESQGKGKNGELALVTTEL